MKKLVTIVMCVFIVGMTVTLKSQNMTQEEKNNYALGANIGESLKNGGITDIDFKFFKEGFEDALKGENKFSMEEMQSCFSNIQEKITAKQTIEQQEEKEKGKKFLEENKKRKEVIETASGLQYQVIVMGKGSKPEATDKVKVHYTGRNLEDKVFDSSIERGDPIEFQLNQVIAGWTEGLQLMPVGSRFMFFIPSDLAYGDRKISELIKPGSTLIFEVELLDITK